MKIRSVFALCVAMLVSSFTFAADLVDDYTISEDSTTYTRSEGWSVSDGATIIFKYANLPQSGTDRLVSWSQSNQTRYTGIVGLCSNSGVLKGWWQDANWTGGTINTTELGSEGLVVCVYGPNNEGVTAYDANGTITFRADDLRATGTSATMGTRFDFSSCVSDIAIYNGATSTEGIAALVATYNAAHSAQTPDFSWTPGTNPSGWFTSWKGEDTTGKPRTVIGAKGAESAYVVYNTDASNKWHPYRDNLGQWGDFAISLYGSTDMIETPDSGQHAVLFCVGENTGCHLTLALDSERRIVVLQQNRTYLYNSIVGPTVKGYHLLTLSMASQTATLAVDGTLYTQTTGSWYPYFNLMAAGKIQIGSTYGGNPDGRVRADGLVVKEMVGYSKALSATEIASLSAAYPAVTSVGALDLSSCEGEVYCPNIAITESVTVGEKANLVLKPNDDYTISQVISGAGRVTADPGVNHSMIFDARNTFTGGLTVLSGTARQTITDSNANRGFGPNNLSDVSSLAEIFVEKGAILDLAKTKDACYFITSEGEITNTGDAISNGSRQTTRLTVAETTTVSGRQFGLLGPGWAATTLDLTGGNLIVKMESADTYFLLCNTTIIEGGVIRLEQGKLYLKKSIKGTLAIDLPSEPQIGDQIFVVDDDNNLADMAIKVTVNGEALPLGVQVSSTGVVVKVDPDVVVEKDDAAHTWTIDTTKAAYEMPSGDIATLKKESWLVTLKSSSENGATLDFGENKAAQASRYVIESGTHNLIWAGTVQTMNFDLSGTDTNPSILVKDGATLNFTARDVTGWNNNSTATKGNVIRVNAGGELKLLQYATNTFFYQGRFYLEPGATIETSYSANSVRFNGGTSEENPQIYVPSPTTSATTVTYTNDAGFRLASNATKGYAVCVEAGSTLEMIGAFSTEANDCKLAKYGKGTLVLDGSFASFGGSIIFKDGVLKVRENSGLDAAKVIPAEGETRQIGSVTADGWTVYSFGDPIATVGLIPYWDLREAFVVASNGGVVTILDETIIFEDGVFKREGETIFDPATVAIEVVKNEEDGTYTTRLSIADFAALRISEIMPKPVDKPASTLYPASLARYDKNGLESGWVELENMSDKWVDLADYAFTRVNRGKATKIDAGAFPSTLIAPHAKYVFYTSERYSNSISAKDSAWQHGTFDGKPKYFDEYDMMIWGDKVNPKKSPFVRLYYVKGGAETPIDTVVIPIDFPEGHSIIVEKAVEGETLKRYMTQYPTPGSANATGDLVTLGPTVGPLYEISSKKKHTSTNEFGPVAPAKIGEDYEIVFPLNPVMSPTAIAGFRDEDAITSITLLYRTDLDDKTLTRREVSLEKTTDNADQGDLYTAVIPHEAFDTIGAGHLIQWKFEVTDKSNVTFTSPSHLNKDDGYEWYGTIVEPGELNSESLATWHMFADSVSLQQMDVDAPKQDLSKVPYNARIAIYDSSTSNYYDYVRIDLRGNTSAHFNKKSHGLRFSKAHPLTMWDPVAGEMREEVRKSSLIGEPADPSYMRQMMSFWLWTKMGNKVPFDFPVRCNLNGKFFQMAFHSERFTDELIEDFHKLDKYGYGYKNVGTLKSGSGTTAGGIEKKTPDDGDESNVSVLQNQFRSKIVAAQQVKNDLNGVSTEGLDNPTLTKFVVEKFNLPAWLNYLASARITQEMDDVWANISIYYDNAEMKEGVRGTDTWMPLGYDFNLSLGQWYHNDVGSGYGLMANQDWFKSHPFYGGNRVRCYKSTAYSTTCNSGNDGMEAVWQNAKFRRLYLRRLRTLMDQELGAPDTTGEENETNSQISLMKKIREIAALMEKDAVLDRTRWPHDSSIGNIDVWGGDKPWPESMQAGIKEIWDDYIVPRRQHLYVTHSISNTEKGVGYGTNLAAGIPEAQSSIADLKSGFTAEYREDIAALVIKNTNAEAVDMSGWALSGPVSMTLPAGTVIDEGSEENPAEVYVSADRRATIAKMNELGLITNQIVVGNGEAVETEVITLKAGEETVIAPPEPSAQEKYLKLYGFCGAPLTDNDGIGEFIIFENIGTEALDVGGAAINICKTADADSASKCAITLAEGVSIAGGDYLRIAMADKEAKFGGTWSKITDGDLRITMTDSTGVQIYYREMLSQSAIGVKAVDKFAKHIYADDTWVAAELSEAPGYVAPEPPPVEPIDPPAEGDITGDFDDLQTFEAGVYTLNGANFNGGVKIDGDVTLTLKGENTLSTMTTTGTLTIEGDGTLTIDYANGEAGTAAVTLTKPYIQNGGNVVVNLSSENQVFGFYCNTATKDALGNGIYAVELNGGTFTTTIAGGESSAAFKLGKGTNDAKLGGTDVTVTLGGTAPRFMNTDGKIKLTKNCGKVTVTTATEGGTKANVFKSKKEIEINGGTVVATASGEGSEIFSSDDTILVKGGVLNLTAADDCFSAANHINISGGIVYAMSTAGDAIDSNGDMTISGGYVFAFTTSTEHEALDVDPSEDPTAVDNGIAHKLYINEGATVVAVGGLSTVHGPDDGSTAKCLVKTGLSSSSKYLVMTGIVDDENVRRTTTATVNLNKKHAKTFTLIATMPGFTGEITEGGDEVKPSTGKLADEISGMFVNTVESSIVTPSGATTWEEVVVTETTTVAELVGAEQGAMLVELKVEPKKIVEWAKTYSSSTKPGEAINLVAFALNCAPNEEAIEAAKKNFKVTITMTAEGPVAEIESGDYNITPVLKGKAELAEEGSWTEVTDDNKSGFKFFRAFIEIGE
ncbi:MAG: CotH kinase family protein [Kiritimatiellae bacterium]|nr:CotH kinase family protein [Kiritimatiellia bacterium]